MSSVPLDTAGSSWLGQVDPYFGEPWDGVMLGPYPAHEWIDMTAEPTEVFTYDEAGSIVSRQPAPIYRCATCGRETTRRVCVSLTAQPGHPNTMNFLGEYRAECQSCARVRAAPTE